MSRTLCIHHANIRSLWLGIYAVIPGLTRDPASPRTIGATSGAPGQARGDDSLANVAQSFLSFTMTIHAHKVEPAASPR